MDDRPLSRRRFLSVAGAGTAWLALGAPATTRAASSDGFDELTWLPAWRLRELIAGREVSPVEVIDHFLARAKGLDGSLGSFVRLAESEAREAARRAEAAVMRGDELGPFHGIPVSVKQLVRTEGLPLEDGELAGSDYVTAERIRRSGGIILGNTALAGPAAMLGEDTAGAANPWSLDRVGGASSSGAAAGVAAGLCPVAIGSDGGGSTRLPAAYCGVIGMHPTVGRVPAHHDVWRSVSRMAWSATFGPISRDARDAATLLNVIAGPDWRHLLSFNGPAPDYLHGLEDGVRGMRMAWTPDFGSASQYFTEESASVVAEVRRAAEGFVPLGAELEEPAFSVADWYPVFTRIVIELSLGGWYPIYAGATRAIAGVRGRPASPGTTGELDEALEARHAMANEFLKLFERYDVLLSATAPVVAPTREQYLRWLESESYPEEYTCLTGHMNLLGFPALSIPCGFVQGMPVGLQLVAAPDQDAKLLRVATAFLDAYPAERRPAFAKQA